MLDRIDVKYFKLAVGMDNIGKETDVDISARCPICGDSRKKKNSKRLHLYTKGTVTNINCFNGDCSCQNKTVYSFLRDFFPPLLDKYKKEQFGNTMKKLANGETDDVFKSFKKETEEKQEKQEKQGDDSSGSNEQKSTVTFEEKKALASYKTDKKNQLFDFIIEQIQVHHLHPISVHFPNGIIPVCVAFIVLSIILGSKSLSDAYLYNLIFVFLSMPVVLFSGYVEWKNKFKGIITNTFITKIVCGFIVFCTSFISIIWKIFNPDIFINIDFGSYILIFINIIMLIAAGIAGHIGGKLVFKD